MTTNNSFNLISKMQQCVVGILPSLLCSLVFGFGRFRVRIGYAAFRTVRFLWSNVKGLFVITYEGVLAIEQDVDASPK